MTTQTIGLLKAITAKMGYLDHRQQILAQNIANGDTPGYRPHDLTKVDFGRVLQNVTKSNHVRPVVTNEHHMPSAGKLDTGKDRQSKMSYEVAPTGNAVIVEEQMINASKTTMDYNLMTTLYQKNVSMIKTALGRTQ